MTHSIKNEREQTIPNGTRLWTLSCECGREFSSRFAAGLTPRRSARAAYRRHLDETPVRSHIRMTAIEVQGGPAAIAQAARIAGALIEDGDEDD